MFTQSVIESIKNYVYFLKDPRDGKVFYIGKGEGNRIFEHVNCALKKQLKSDKIDVIKEIIESGHKVGHYVVRHGLDEDTAFAVESALIDFVGLSNLSNVQSGHQSGTLGIKTTDEIEATYNAEKLVTDLPILLINLNKLYHRNMTDEELYEATRKEWVLGVRRNNVRFAVATYRGLTREVFAVDSWHSFIPNEPNKKTRWGFEGCVAPQEVRQALRYKDMTQYYPKGAANPIQYLNC